MIRPSIGEVWILNRGNDRPRVPARVEKVFDSRQTVAGKGWDQVFDTYALMVCPDTGRVYGNHRVEYLISRIEGNQKEVGGLS